MTTWQPSPEQLETYERDGYFVVRNVIPRDVAIELRGVIKNTIHLFMLVNAMPLLKDRRAKKNIVDLDILFH